MNKKNTATSIKALLNTVKIMIKSTNFITYIFIIVKNIFDMNSDK